MSPAAPWRLLIDDRCPAAWNMALDRAIQVARDRGESPPTLRLYQWERPTVTLGKFQDVASIDLQACVRAGVDVVRRFTGGRGVLHDDELTYSVVASTSDGVPRGTAASYRYLSAALANAYRGLGVGAELVARDLGVRGSSACYLHSTAADLSLRGRKLSGSAQVWLHDTVLQHGSFVRTRDIAREAAVFGLDRDDAERLGDSTVTLGDELGEPPSLPMLKDAVVGGFSSALGVEFELGEPSELERALAEDLLPQAVVDVRAPSGADRA